MLLENNIIRNGFDIEFNDKFNFHIYLFLYNFDLGYIKNFFCLYIKIMKFSDAYTEHSSKHRDYFSIYDEILNDNNIDRFGIYNILEIGVDTGHGLRALKKYFPNSKIYGLDILKDCKKHQEENIEVIIGSQVDENILKKLSEYKFDLIIDDGSHLNDHVYTTFDYLFKYLKADKIGLYIVEDIHTSYWPYYKGGLKKETSTVEQFKNLIDYQNAWAARDPIVNHIYTYQGIDIEKTYYEEWLKYIQFYENIIVIKKRNDKARCSKPI